MVGGQGSKKRARVAPVKSIASHFTSVVGSTPDDKSTQ